MRPRSLIGLFLTAALTGCGAPSVDELVASPELLTRTAAKCRDMATQRAQRDRACINAYRAADAVAMANIEAELTAARQLPEELRPQ